MQMFFFHSECWQFFYFTNVILNQYQSNSDEPFLILCVNKLDNRVSNCLCIVKVTFPRTTTREIFITIYECSISFSAFAFELYSYDTSTYVKFVERFRIPVYKKFVVSVDAISYISPHHTIYNTPMSKCMFCFLILAYFPFLLLLFVSFLLEYFMHRNEMCSTMGLEFSLTKSFSIGDYLHYVFSRALLLWILTL